MLLQSADKQCQRSAENAECSTAEDIFRKMNPRDNANHCQKYSARKKKDAGWHQSAAPECADQKDGEHMSAWKRLSVAVSGNQRLYVIYFVRARAVDELPYPAHGQKEKRRKKQKRKEPFVEHYGHPYQQSGIKKKTRQSQDAVQNI